MSRFGKYVLGGVAGLVLALFLAVAGYTFAVTRDLPDYDALAHYEPPITTRVYAGNGTLIGEYARERRLFVPHTSIPPLVRDAFISAEDKNFYSHPGVDVAGIIRAAVNNVRNVVEDRRLEGASTITQQVARNFLLTSEVKFSRKVREAILAMRIDNAFSKDKVLELYLNQIFLGQNSYGVAAAAANYFDKPLDELTLPEAAYLAALPKAPSNYHPVRRKDAAIARRNWVIDQMADNGYVTREEAETAKATDLLAKTRSFGAVAPDVDYFVEEVRRILYAQYGEQPLYDGGLQVRSTLDTRLQELAVRSLRGGLIAYDRRHGWRGPVSKIDMTGDWTKAFEAIENRSGVDTWRLAVVTKIAEEKNGAAASLAFAGGLTGTVPVKEMTYGSRAVKLAPGDVIYVEPLGEKAEKDAYGLRQVPAVNGALIALNPFTGQVLALAGGFSYRSSEFDRAMQALRQPGSTFKPFVYAAALDNGYTPVSKILDAPIALSQGEGLPLWTPENYSEEYYGLTTLRRGLELSRNVMTVRLANEIGMEPIVKTVEAMGVYDKLPPYLSMSLGAGDTTLLRMVTGYAEFVNGGRKLVPTLVDRIQDRHGKTIYRHDQRACEGCNDTEWTGQEEPLLPENRPLVLDPRTAYQVVSLLEGAVQRGTGTVMKSVGKPIAGKTGTSNDFRDAWFIGFSPDLVVGAYIGFDEPKTLGRGEAGAVAAAPMVRDFMTGALADALPTPFRIPDGVVLMSVNPHTGDVMEGGAPGSILEAFKPGTEPGLEIVDGLFGENGNFAFERPAAPNADAVNVQVGSGTGGLY